MISMFFCLEQALDGGLRVFVVLHHQHFLNFRVQQPLDAREHAIDILYARRLGEIADRPFLKRHQRSQIRHAADDMHGDVAGLQIVLELVEHAHAVDIGQAEVENDGGDVLFRRQQQAALAIARA